MPVFYFWKMVRDCILPGNHVLDIGQSFALTNDDDDELPQIPLLFPLGRERDDDGQVVDVPYVEVLPMLGSAGLGDEFAPAGAVRLAKRFVVRVPAPAPNDDDEMHDFQWTYAFCYPRLVHILRQLGFKKMVLASNQSQSAASRVREKLLAAMSVLNHQRDIRGIMREYRIEVRFAWHGNFDSFYALLNRPAMTLRRLNRMSGMTLGIRAVPFADFRAMLSVAKYVLSKPEFRLGHRSHAHNQLSDVVCARIRDILLLVGFHPGIQFKNTLMKAATWQLRPVGDEFALTYAQISASPHYWNMPQEQRNDFLLFNDGALSAAHTLRRRLLVVSNMNAEQLAATHLTIVNTVLITEYRSNFMARYNSGGNACGGRTLRQLASKIIDNITSWQRDLILLSPAIAALGRIRLRHLDVELKDLRKSIWAWEL